MIDYEQRTVSPNEQPKDKEIAQQLRPSKFNDFIGQDAVVKRLKVAIAGAKQRGEQLDHILLCAPPGIGKTTLAYIIASELDQKAIQALGTNLTDADAVRLLAPMANKRGILFLDELIKPAPKLTTCICKAMEEYYLIRGFSTVKLKPFTLIAASTDAGSIPSPMRDRFTHILHLSPYTEDELVKIARRSAKLLDMEAEEKALNTIAKRSRGTPRITNRLLKISRDFTTNLDARAAQRIMRELGIDEYGLDSWDRKYLKLLAVKFDGGPVGLTTLAGALQETEKTIETVLEPFLLAQGLILKSGRGRLLTAQGIVIANQTR